MMEGWNGGQAYVKVLKIVYQSIFRKGPLYSNNFMITYFIITKYRKDISRKNFTGKINTEGRSKEVGGVFKELSLFRI